MTDDRLAFARAAAAAPDDDTAWAAYADWLDDGDDRDAAAAVRWWVAARREFAGADWDSAVDWDDLAGAALLVGTGADPRVAVLYAVTVGHLVESRYPAAGTGKDPWPAGWSASRVRQTAALYALGAAPTDEAKRARRAAEVATEKTLVVSASFWRWPPPSAAGFDANVALSWACQSAGAAAVAAVRAFAGRSVHAAVRDSVTFAAQSARDSSEGGFQMAAAMSAAYDLSARFRRVVMPPAT